MPAYEWPEQISMEADIYNAAAWRHEHHWQADQVTISVAGAGGQQNVGGGVPAGQLRTIREITVRHAGTNNTVITILIAGFIRLSFDVSASSSVTWSSENGVMFGAGEQPIVESSDVTGGNSYVSARGEQASV